MSEKVDFNGDVGQAVMGDVKEAARLSNVVNLNLSETQKEVPLITDYQRKRINVLVKEWSAICGDKEIEIYKVFITDFGLRKFRELPKEHYLAVKATLEGWIAGASKAATARPHHISESRISAAQAHTHCPICAERDVSAIRSQRTIFAQCVLIFILAGLSAWLLYKMPSTAITASQTVTHCYFEGKPYSVGSTIRTAGGVVRECAIGDADEKMTWVRPK